MNDYGKVKDCHSPRNEDCAHNVNCRRDCTCKRERKRKPYKRVLVHDEGVGHNVRSDIVLEIWPQNGVLVLREKRRRKRFSTTTADVYGWLVRGEALTAMAARREARKQRRQERRKGVKR
jgi:hypothetical protein